MSLQKQTVAVPMVDGLSDNDDNFASDPPGFISINEARWGRDKQIGKRFGLSMLVNPNDGVAVATATDANQVVDLDDVPHLVSGGGTYRRDPKLGTWASMNLAAPRPSRVTSDPLVRANYGAVKPDAAIAGQVVCCVWEEYGPDASNQGAFYGFWDVTNDTPRPISGPTKFSSVTSCMRVVSVAGRYFIATGYDSSGFIYSCAYDINAATWSFSAPSSIEQTNDNQYGLCPTYDATTGAYVAYISKGTGNITVKALSTAGAVTATRSNITGSSVQHVLHNGPISKVVVISKDGSLVYGADNLGSAFTTGVSLFTNPTSTYYNNKFTRASIGLADTSGNMYAARSTHGPYTFAGTLGTLTQLLAIDTSFAASKANTVGGVTLGAHFSPYITESEAAFVGLLQTNAYQTANAAKNSSDAAFKAAPVAYIARIITDQNSKLSFAVSGRYGADAVDFTGNTANATAAVSLGSANPTSHLPHLAYDQNDGATTRKLISAFPMLIDIVYGGNSTSRRRGVNLASIRPHISTPTRNVFAQSLRVLSGGHGTSIIDGNEHVEMTPPVPEYILFDGTDAASAGNTPTHYDGSGGTPTTNTAWSYQVFFRYIDARGNVHRGSPSSIYQTQNSQQFTAGNASKLCMPNPAPTAMIGDKAIQYDVEVYAAPYDSPSTYKLLGIVTPKADPSDEGRVYVAITSGGTQLAYGVDLNTWDSGATRQLYTSSGGGSELDSWPSPPMLSLCSTQSRLWGLNAEDRLDVWYTKPLALGFAPEWSSTLRVRIPQDGGPAVGIAALDDKVVVFKRNKVFVIEGDPGDAAGNNSSLRRPRLVSSDIGCTAVESIVEGPFGIIFQSERGIFTLDRGLSYQFVGQSVMDQLTPTSDGLTRTITSGCIIPSEAEVRYVADTARGAGDLRGLAWNYRLNRWCRRDANAPRFSANVGGVEHMVWRNTSDGSVGIAKETPYDWTTEYAGAAVTGSSVGLLSFRSSWIKLNGIAGYGRIWRVVFLLRWFINGIQIQTAQDYKLESESTRSWTHAELATLYDSNTNRLQLAVHPKVQKCEAIQLVVTEVAGSQQTGGSLTGGRGFELIGVELEVGIRPGAYKRIPVGGRK